MYFWIDNSDGRMSFYQIMVMGLFTRCRGGYNNGILFGETVGLIDEEI